MENATKALLIGAGMLFAVAIVSLMIYAYFSITGYYSEQQSSMTKEQITEFNNEYEAYNREDVTGFEIVSLINKIINYNNYNAVDENLGFENTDKNYEKMYIEFTIKNSDILNGIDGVKLFTSNKYDSENSKTNTALEKIMTDMQSLESTYTAGVLSKLVSNRYYLSIYGGDGSKDIKQVLGKNTDEKDLPKLEDVLKYEQYIEFKRAEFKCTKTEYNNSTGRIVKLIFEEV